VFWGFSTGLLFLVAPSRLVFFTPGQLLECGLDAGVGSQESEDEVAGQVLRGREIFPSVVANRFVDRALRRSSADSRDA
jgi:hypothetical protein